MPMSKDKEPIAIISNIIEQISVLSVPLTIKSYNGAKLGTATGFFWRQTNSKTYLVSNYHVMSGSHFATGASARRDSGTPGKIEYPRFVSLQHLHQRAIHTVELCGEAGNEQTWLTHPLHHHGRPVDLAIVEVPTTASDESFVFAVNDDPLHECDTFLRRYPPGFELIIAGFLLEDRPTGYFPTYVRGFVASEMDALYHGKRAFLIDAHTSSGMSGSPVFATGLERIDARQKFGPFKTAPRFVGIYSGRIIENENGKKRELQVGVVWRRELIHETIQINELPTTEG
jgi:hypothetical protein